MMDKNTYTKEEVAELLNCTFSKMKESQDRYITNEQFIMDYHQLPFWKRWLFGRDIILAHLQKMILDGK